MNLKNWRYVRVIGEKGRGKWHNHIIFLKVKKYLNVTSKLKENLLLQFPMSTIFLSYRWLCGIKLWVSSRLLYPVMASLVLLYYETPWQWQLRREWNLFSNSRLQSIVRISRWQKPETDSHIILTIKVREKRIHKCLLSHLIYKSGHSVKGMVLPTVPCAFPHQLRTKISHGHTHKPIWPKQLFN